jgi:hypothetical protein
MGFVFQAYATGGVAVVGAGLITVAPIPALPLPGAQIRGVQLANADSIDTADSPLGDGVALVMGPSGVPLTAPSYLEAVDQLYLAPRGFTGTVQGVPTPEGLNPITGPKSLTFDASEAQGQKILDTDILQQIATGHVSAENPVVVFGYSQSAVISAQIQQELASQGVPSDDVHFIMVADESIPNGGSLSSFDLPIGAHPSAPSLGLTISGAQPNDLYPTDVYTQEYDGFADFPRYPADGFATLNALIGILTQHIIYTSLPESEIADAIQLPTTAADTLTNYYMIPTEQLPLLEPLLLFGNPGKVLYDLLEPDMRILVDLGYGSLTEGWNQGPADVPTPVGFLPNINLGDLFTALSNGAKEGITDAVHDLQNPEPPPPPGSLITDNPVLSTIIDGFRTWGVNLPEHPTLIDFGKALLENFTGYPVSDATLGSSSLTDIVNGISGTISGDIANLTPLADTANALLTSLPAAGINLLVDSFEAGHPIQGIEEALGAFGGLVPFALFYGAVVPLANEVGGTLINLADLFGLGDLSF